MIFSALKSPIYVHRLKNVTSTKKVRTPIQKKKRDPIKHTGYRLELKRELLALSKTMSTTELSKIEFMIDGKIKTISRGTLHGILKDEEKIMAAVGQGFGPNRMKLRGAKHPEVEEQTVEWIASQRNRFTPITGDLIKFNFLFIVW